MKKYTVDAFYCNLPPGTKIELSKAQAAARANSLRRINKGRTYEVLETVQFKRGEVIGLSKPPKGVLQHLEPVEADKADRQETRQEGDESGFELP
jgi:hypothetical protein